MAKNGDRNLAIDICRKTSIIRHANQSVSDLTLASAVITNDSDWLGAAKTGRAPRSSLMAGGNMRNRWVVVTVLGAGVTAMLAATSLPAAATTFHEYSFGEDYTTGTYTGVASTRIDSAVTQAHDGCTTWYTGSNIWQDEWVEFDWGNPPQGWVEFATLHQCSNTKQTHAYAYGAGGVFHPIGHDDSVTDGVSHVFYIKRSGGNTWNFIIDSTTEPGTYTSTAAGVNVQAGLESWDGTATVPVYDDSALRFTSREGAWTSWAGEDAQRVDGSPMCGTWNAATVWRVSEGSPC